MRRLGVGLVGIAVGIGLTLLVVFLRPSSNWQEQSVRWQAGNIGCGMAQGLNVKCVPVATLRKTANFSWIAIYGRAEGRRLCYELRPADVPSRRRACPTCAASECVSR